MQIRFLKKHPDAVVPKKAHSSDAGFDLTAVDFEYSKGIWTYHTGIAVEIPSGYVGLVFPRSSIFKQGVMLTNSVGVIDSGYRGEIMAKFKGDGQSYGVGDRIAQLIIMPYPEIDFVESDELNDSDRGTGGYGSSGR